MQHQVANGVFADGFSVQCIVVIGFKIAVPRDFPSRAVNVALFVEIPIRQIEGL